MVDVQIRFAPNQPLPPGYSVEWWECDEHYHWVHDPSRATDGEPEVYSDATCCRFSARRGAWAHFNRMEGSRDA